MAEEDVSSPEPSLRDTLTAAVEQHETPSSDAPEPQPAPDGGPPVPRETPASDSDGDAAPPSQGEPDSPPARVQPRPDKAAPSRDGRVDRPPGTWKGDARQHWGQLPLPVRQEIVRREAAISSTLEEIRGVRQWADNFAKTIRPYTPRLNQLGVDPVTATQRLFDADRIMSTGTPSERASFVAKLINDYGIDIPTLDNIMSGHITAEAQPDNMVRREVQQQLQPFMQFANQWQNELRRNQQAQQGQADDLVARMAQDQRFPHLAELRYDMADLIDMAHARGIKLTLEQAYNKAAAAHDEIGPLVAQQRVQQQAQSASQEAQRAKAASVSIGGPPRGAAPPNGPDGDSVRAAIEHAIAVNSRRA